MLMPFRCPHCGAEVKSGWRFCKQCAYDLQAGPVPYLGSRACRRCGSSLAAGLKFCEACGTPVDISQAQAVTPVAGFGSTAAAAPTQVIEPDEETRVVARSPALQCRECGAQIAQGVAACSVCGAAVSGVPQRLAISRSLQLGLITGAAVVLLGVGAFVVYYFWYGNSAIEKKLDAAITRGNLFQPQGQSAYDLYHQLKNNGADTKTLAPFEDKLVPQLTTQPLKLISDFAVPTNAEPVAADWQNALKPMQWAVEMRPNDNGLNAREKYIEGRIAFISNQKDQALDLWKKASDLDRTWAMPPNGVGVIYNEKKSFEAARKYLFEAIRREASWAVPYNSIGTSYFFEKKYDDAWTYYMKAIERSSNWARPHVWLGDVAMRRNDFATAADEYQKALDLAQSGNTALDLNDIKKRLDQAKKKSQAENEIID
jgi:Flp pilus assembly protein TadD